MRNHSGHHNDAGKPSRFWFLFLPGFLIIAIAIQQSFRGIRAADTESVAATYAKGVVHVAIPYQASTAGAGQLTLEVLDPDDAVLGSVQRRLTVAAGKGAWQEDLKLAKTVDAADLVWHRLRYRFTYANRADAAIEGTEAFS